VARWWLSRSRARRYGGDIIAVSVNTDGRREVMGMETGTSKSEPIWTKFLRMLTRRGLRSVKLVVSDAHEGIKAAGFTVLYATWQRLRVHFACNVLAHAGDEQAGDIRHQAS
jgi:putative transposase